MERRSTVNLAAFTSDVSINEIHKMDNKVRDGIFTVVSIDNPILPIIAINKDPHDTLSVNGHDNYVDVQGFDFAKERSIFKKALLSKHDLHLRNGIPIHLTKNHWTVRIGEDPNQHNYEFFGHPRARVFVEFMGNQDVLIKDIMLQQRQEPQPDICVSFPQPDEITGKTKWHRTVIQTGPVYQTNVHDKKYNDPLKRSEFFSYQALCMFYLETRNHKVPVKHGKKYKMVSHDVRVSFATLAFSDQCLRIKHGVWHPIDNLSDEERDEFFTRLAEVRLAFNQQYEDLEINPTMISCDTYLRNRRAFQKPTEEVKSETKILKKRVPKNRKYKSI